MDDARDLRERAFFAPVSSRYKVYVIDEAHMVSSAGFNALLKLVEEPPEYVKFVFATTEPEKVLGTIKSRTHHYPFRLIPPSVLRPYLEQLATAEGVKVEPAVFPLVVRAGGGSARDSLSVLDQLIAGAGEAGVTYARAVALLGVTDVALIDEVCDALAAGDGAAVYSTINSVAEAGHDARRFAGDLLERLRNLIVLQQVPDAIEKGLLDGADDELARMRTAVRAVRPGDAVPDGRHRAHRPDRHARHDRSPAGPRADRRPHAAARRGRFHRRAARADGAHGAAHHARRHGQSSNRGGTPNGPPLHRQLLRRQSSDRRPGRFGNGRERRSCRARRRVGRSAGQPEDADGRASSERGRTFGSGRSRAAVTARVGRVPSVRRLPGGAGHASAGSRTRAG